MKNIKRVLLSLSLILVSFFVFNDRVDAIAQLECEYEGVLNTFCNFNDETCKVKVTLKLEQNQWSLHSFTWINGFVEEIEGCGAGENIITCLKNFNPNELRYNIVPGVKVIKDNNGKYEFVDSGYSDYFLNDNKTYYQCPETINILRREEHAQDGERDAFGLGIFVSTTEFNENYCDNNSIDSFGCDGSNNQRDTFQKTKQVSAMPYTGGEIEHSSGSCCVYMDSKSNVPVYVYTYDKSISGKNMYAACAGLNCMTLNPSANLILNDTGTNGTEWNAFHKLDDCSKMPSKIWFTFNGNKYERTLDSTINCKAPTTEPSNVNKTYVNAVMHPTEKSAQELISGGSDSGDEDNNPALPDPVPVECTGILGEELLDFLNKIFRWIRIIAPILVIVLSSVEFAGALLQDDRDALKKASNRFVKRLIIAVALFLVPLILEFVLDVFNEITKSDSSICDIGK